MDLVKGDNGVTDGSCSKGSSSRRLSRKLKTKMKEKNARTQERRVKVNFMKGFYSTKTKDLS